MMNRLYSRREREASSSQPRDKSRDKKIRPLSGDGLMSFFKSDPQKKVDRELAQKIAQVREMLQQAGYMSIGDEKINYALSSNFANGDTKRAFEAIVMFQQSVEGVIQPFNPDIQMQAAQNRLGKTCWLDSLLFSMFVKSSSFEPILYTKFEDAERRRLSSMIRLWVNMLRAGKLIPIDVTQYLQEALAACGWEEAVKLEQQDASEAFQFIAETLELPLLTLKMDIFHHATPDDDDDHKFIKERLLEVAIDEPEDGRTQSLEECLENYFNNKVEVTRLQRANTISSIRSGSSHDAEKEAMQVLVTETWSAPNTPISAHRPPSTRSYPTLSRSRNLDDGNGSTRAAPENSSVATDNPRDQDTVAATLARKEVTIPAWQFFNLLPWYTTCEAPPTSAGLTKNLEVKQPVLGICLKRYGVKDGRPYRKNTSVDIPQEIRLPHFINDNRVPGESSEPGNFKLVLQAAVCHRGISLDEGHYISLARGNTLISDGDSKSPRRQSNTNRPPHYSEDQWYKFDDLATPRVRTVRYEDAVQGEMPYLLFYQVQPNYEVPLPPNSDLDPPSYDSGVAMNLTNSTPSTGSELERPTYFDGTTSPYSRPSDEVEYAPTARRSFIILNEYAENSVDNVTCSQNSSVINPNRPGSSALATPGDETKVHRLSRAASRFTKSASKSRPTSQSGESRISAKISRLNLMRSKEHLGKAEVPKEAFMTSDSANEKSISMEESGLSPRDGNVNRTRSKREKKSEKNRRPTEKTEDLEHEKYRMKDVEKDCVIM